ncbi:hypothetical protein EYF80_057343 [Liparis tanakae]|uniref:Uncharacterized protein n=1 Tax=Liparis tanakae TaxID=230148 RepID=A0A4Z2EU90_9TELE|nr:hypothetical protein EYF80_057343 [Liparis tanakae]
MESRTPEQLTQSQPPISHLNVFNTGWWRGAGGGTKGMAEEVRGGGPEDDPQAEERAPEGGPEKTGTGSWGTGLKRGSLRGTGVWRRRIWGTGVRG